MDLVLRTGTRRQDRRLMVIALGPAEQQGQAPPPATLPSGPPILRDAPDRGLAQLLVCRRERSAGTYP